MTLPDWNKINIEKQVKINWGIAVKLAHLEMMNMKMPLKGNEALLKKLIHDYFVIIDQSCSETFK